MIAQLKNLRALSILFVLLALAMGRSATGQTYGIVPTAVSDPPVIGNVTFHTGPDIYGSDVLSSFSDLVTPSSTQGKVGPFTTRLNYSLLVRYYYKRVQGSYTAYYTSSSYISHQVSGSEQYSFGYSDVVVDSTNTASQDPTAWFTTDVAQSPGTVTLLGIEYYYQFFASMEDAYGVGFCYWPSTVYTSAVVTFGSTPSGGW